MPDLQEWFGRIDEVPMPDLKHDIDERGVGWSPEREPSTARRVLVMIAAMSLGLSALFLAVRALRPAGSKIAVAVSPASPVGPAAPNLLPSESFPVDGTAGSIAASDGWVWVATNDFDQQGAILDKIDPSTGNVTSSIPLPDSPSFLAAGAGSVWVPVNPGGGDPVMLQVDAATDEIADQFPGLFGPVVASSDGTVWAVQAGTDGQSEVVRLESGSITARVAVAAAPFDMVEAAGSIWVLLLPSDREPALDANLIRIDEGSGSVLASLNVQPSGIWLAGNDQGVWLSSGLSELPGTSVFVSAADNSVSPFGNIYNFRPFAVANGHVWFIAGPHDGPIQGTCGLNLDTQVADVCANEGAAPDLEVARDPAAYEPSTNTIWTGVYSKALVRRVTVSA